MSMALMVAMASRKRDDQERRNDGNRMDGNRSPYSRMEDGMEMRRRRDERGRYMEDDMRMGNDHSTQMRMETPEMRRRRDSRGRYMEDEDDGPRMAYDGNAAMRPWPEPHIPPYLDRPGMEQEPYRMRDSNVVNIRDYQDRRRIGFESAENEGGREMRQYGRRYDPTQMHYGEQMEQQTREGHTSGREDERLTKEEAEKWVNGMKSDDGKTGGRWSYQEIKQYASNFGIGPDEVVDFFAVMNALATDYGKVAKRYGVDKVDFWADMAKAFMHDKDAVPDKVRVYFECIAKKDNK